MLKIAYHPSYIHPLPDGHRFPMVKYELIAAQLLYEGLVEMDNFFEPSLVDIEIACLAHARSYVSQLYDLTLDPRMVRRIGFPLSKELVDRERYIVQGTIQSALFALQHGVSFNIAGGTHHAGYDFGEGFCLLNDQAIAAKYLLQHGYAKKIMIVDLDVHQGNGTAHIFQQQQDIVTFSMHGIKNYPFVKERSHYDIGLENGIGDEEYLSILYSRFNEIQDIEQPDFIFYQAGVDILETDKLGKLSISPIGCKMRDRFILEQCYKQHIPIQISMGGGYSPQIKDIVHAHVETYRAAIDIYHY